MYVLIKLIFMNGKSCKIIINFYKGWIKKVFDNIISYCITLIRSIYGSKKPIFLSRARNTASNAISRTFRPTEGNSQLNIQICKHWPYTVPGNNWSASKTNTIVPVITRGLTRT